MDQEKLKHIANICYGDWRAGGKIIDRTKLFESIPKDAKILYADTDSVMFEYKGVIDRTTDRTRNGKIYSVPDDILKK